MLSEVIQTDDALLAIKDEWKSLSAAVPATIDFFGGWNHVWNAVQIMPPAKWFVVTVRESEHKRLVAVFAWELLNVQTAGKAYRAVQPLASMLSPYVEFAVEPSHLRPALQALLDTLARASIDMLCLWPMHEASPLFNTLTEDMRNHGSLKTFRYPSNLREIETRGLQFTDYIRNKSSKTFANSYYCERRLKRAGSVHFTLCEPPDKAVDIAKQLCAVSTARFGNQFAYRSQPDWNRWIAEMVHSLTEQKIAQVSTLRFNETIIAASLSFWHKHRRYFYLTSFDQAYARFSPGKILLYKLIEQTFSDRGVFCFGSGNYRYKDDWARSTGELKAAFVFMNADVQQALSAVVDRVFIAKLATG
ncbi:GNAT family N-acetyltransferase [Vreelandella venusta]|uniref:GNAT family N-acetyltransferase n=1 Tax=Vreelandella venusta TaxID=44935 RepID=UPI00385072C8